LSDEEWRLVAVGSQCMQRRNFEEALSYQYKAVQIKSNHGTDHIGPAPTTFQMARIARDDGDREHQQRKNADNMRR